MKKILTLFLTTCLCFPLMLTASAETLNGTKVRDVADPWLFKHNGNYYLTQTGSTNVIVLESPTISGLASLKSGDYIAYDAKKDPTFVEMYGANGKVAGTWSPEIHYFSEEAAPGNAGWYMFVALRNSNPSGDSREVKPVVLKSTTDSPRGPYGHPITGEVNRSQRLLKADGTPYDEWGIGVSTLILKEGEYKGIYLTFVTETGRGQSGKDGLFYQSIMIAKMLNPWTLGSVPSVVTTPTQQWEFEGSSETHPRVVEGATAVYGTRGDVYITYCGSGYWSTYGIGQITWNGGDPLKTESWVKLPELPNKELKTFNPLFRSRQIHGIYGAGHASFMTDGNGNGFMCYHAYPYENGQKSSSRSAYIEPYYIDYTQWNGTSYGVIRMGATDNRTAANPKTTTVEIEINGTELGTAALTAAGENGVTLTLRADNAKGYALYRSTDGKNFAYYADVTENTYTDSKVTEGETYYYRAYSYREEELGKPSEIVSAVASGSGYVELKMTLGKTEYTVNGETKTMDVAPIIRNDRTMLPVRYVGEALGAEIGWDGATSTATLKTADTEIKITVGAAEALVNGKAVPLDSPAFIESSRTYMPVRFVAETLGGAVAWDAATSTATITK